MKQLLFLLLFPCLALAQYQGNAGQKITLGEQTSADGLVFRGVASIDTVAGTSKITRANKQDTSAFLLLDTVTNLLWHYKTANNRWLQAGGSTLDTATMLLPYWRSGRFSGVLPLANGGTGSASQNFVDLTTAQTVGGAKTFTSEVTATRFNPTANTATGTGMFAPTSTSLAFSTNGNQKLTISTNGNLGVNTTNTDVIGYGTSGMLSLLSDTDDGAALAIGKKGTAGATTGTLGDLNFYGQNGGSTTVARALMRGGLDGAINNTFYAFFTASNGFTDEAMRIRSSKEVNIGYGATDNGAYPLQVNGQIFATNATIATSDEKFKENITPLNKGLEIVNKLKPVTFNFISDTKNNFSEYEEVGFIAQDVDRALSTETFAKSIVKLADDSELTSTMGLATQNLIPILTKAIQEQQALIKALEQRILILENK